jgi:hypothetical protein
LQERPLSSLHFSRLPIETLLNKQDILLHSLLRYPWKTKNVTEIILLGTKNVVALDEGLVGQLRIDPFFCSALTQFSQSPFTVNSKDRYTFCREWLFQSASVRPFVESRRRLKATELTVA